MLEVESLYFRYSDKPVLKGISYAFKPGVFTAVMGPNGCGKTTLLKNMAGMLKPHSGGVKIKGRAVNDFDLIELAKILGYVPQKILNVPSMTVTESVLCGRIPFLLYSETQADRRICRSIISETGLSAIRNRNLNEISGGELQKTLIAQALAKEPEILLLDEPLNNLDMKNQFEIMKIIAQKTAERKLTAAAVLHDLNSALKFCSEIVLMREGKIVFSGAPEKLNREILADVFSVECEIFKNEKGVYALY